jgi:drug/metabolite transporter, DME family
MKSDPRAGVAMVLAAAALWGTTGTAQAIAGGELSSVWFGALRLAVAAAFFAAYAGLLAHRERAVAGKLRASSVLTAGVSMAAYNLAFFAGVRDTGVAVGTAIALGSGPLWAGLLQSVIARQRPRAIWWLGTVLAVAGGVLLSTGAGQTNASIGMRGVLLCLLSGLSYAVYTLTNKRMVASAPASRVTL